MEEDIMKPFSNSSLVDEAASELERIAPKNSQVEIDVIEDPIGNFSTHIMLHTKSKTYFAKKDDMFLYRSCYKAIRAIKAQIKKKRTNLLHQQVSLKNS
jgi:ribosome-associated translation inhibitor RaiA